MFRISLAFFLFTVVVASTFESVYAQPLQEISTDVLKIEDSSVTVNIIWNYNGASYYEIGCVSCNPNLSNDTTENSFILTDVTPFADGNALLYVIAYHDADEIISAKQAIVKIL